MHLFLYEQLNILYKSIVPASGISPITTSSRDSRASTPSASKVTLVEIGSGEWQLQRNGESHTIRGAGGSEHLEVLKRAGGNTVRTWGIDQLEKSPGGNTFLDRCADLGLNVMLGLWVVHPRHGGDYGNPKFIHRQRDRIRASVRTYRDHPALLLWGLGNEMEEDGEDPRIWQELEILAQIVKEEDPHHPVCTVVAGTDNDKIRRMMEYYTSLDLLGVNIYGGAEQVDQRLTEQGWTRPYLLTEFGPVGHWEVETTPWGAPIEPTSAEKLSTYARAHRAQFEQSRGLCLGTFCFIWGHKQETTATWFGMFLQSGEKTPMVDAMQRIWTGEEPAYRSPIITGLHSSLCENVAPPKSIHEVRVTFSHPDQGPLDFEWLIVAETRDRRSGGDAEETPPTISGCVRETLGDRARIQLPETTGAYRVFIFLRDENGGGDAANFPFYVE